MYNQPFFIPGYSFQAAQPMMRGALGGAKLGAQAMGAANAGRGIGLFGRLGNSLSIFKGINWGGLITNTSKTLNVVNQAIPLVRQVGPMFNNVKSMMKVASIFKDETDVVPSNQIRKQAVSTSANSVKNTYRDTTNVNSNFTNDTELSTSSYSDNSPTFFVNS